MQIEIEREDDGRWLAEIPDLPGVMVYGPTQAEAAAKVKALALRVMADRLEHGESIPELTEAERISAHACWPGYLVALACDLRSCEQRAEPAGCSGLRDCVLVPCQTLSARSR